MFSEWFNILKGKGGKNDSFKTGSNSFSRANAGRTDASYYSVYICIERRNVEREYGFWERVGDNTQNEGIFRIGKNVSSGFWGLGLQKRTGRSEGRKI